MAEKSKSEQIYKVIFVNQGKVYEIYAQHVFQGNLYGFIEVEELLFGEKSSLLVDPTEERLQNEFAGVKRSFIPMHAVIRIDQVEKQGTSKMYASSGDNVAAFPGNYPPRPGKSD